MIIEDLLIKRGMTKYRLAIMANIPHATLNDICSGKPGWKNVLDAYKEGLKTN